MPGRDPIEHAACTAIVWSPVDVKPRFVIAIRQKLQQAIASSRNQVAARRAEEKQLDAP
jgi:hypothetical protein